MNVKCKWTGQLDVAIGLIGNLLTLTSCKQVNLYSVLVWYEEQWVSPTQLRFTTDDGAIIGVNRT